MKKMLVAALLLAGSANAALVTGGTIGNPLVNKNDATGKLVLDTRIVDSNGTPVPTPVAPSMPQSVSITSVPKITTATTTGFTWTQTPVAVNLSTAAGVAGRAYIVHVNSAGPCASFSVDFNTATSTAFFHGAIPPPSYIPLSTTGGVAYGPYGEGMHMLGKSNSSTNCMGAYRIEAQ